ncbi:dihydrolipoyl dehydrogenase [Candidatus Woesearchaeota archaeon]|nr:MAG: dihydrolipoyl dehydrogenase [Candidatus Woesearchaeota archaeon]
MKKRVFDVVVIGAGSGLEISSYAAEQGLNVAVIEPGPFGGTCLNRGCIPSKMLIHAADVARTVQEAGKFGVNASFNGVAWKKLVSRINATIGRDARGIEAGNRSSKNVTVFKEYAQFLGKDSLLVGKEVIQGKRIFICAGSRPFVPKIPGLKEVNYLTSDEALRLPKQPKSIIIIGGGYIGCELAHFFGSLGTKVTIVQRGNLLMGAEDGDIARKFTQVYRRRFTVLLNTDVLGVRKRGREIAVDLKKKGKKATITGEQLLVATGRVPNSDVLNVKAAGVKVNERGFVVVDKYLRTSVQNVWAIGDIAGVFMFKHSANLEAQFAVQNAFGEKVPVDYAAMPHAAFTNPQVASVGATEEELAREKRRFVKNIYEYKNTGYGAALRESDGFVKVLAEPKTGAILGCHILGPHASILIHEVIVAMKAGLGVEGIRQAVHVHPALSEVVQRAFWF